jgi:hypothetical protein
MRTIDHEHNWFWQEGFKDGLNGLEKVVPDETRSLTQRGDYFTGYEAGADDRHALGLRRTLSRIDILKTRSCHGQ